MAVILSAIKIKYNSKKAQLKRAVTILGAADRLRRMSESNLTPVEQIEYEKELAALRYKLKKTRFESAWEDGQKMNMDEAILLATRDDQPPLL